MHLSDLEEQFANLIWENEPLSTANLVKLGEDRFGWKRTTTYTVLKRLENKEIFRKENGVVTALISRDEFYSLRSQEIVQRDYDGSLPAFVAAFTKKSRLSKKEIEKIKKLLDEVE